MKHFIFTLAALTFIVSAPSAKAWFGSQEKERRLEVEQKLVQQQHSTNTWQGAAFLLGIACVVALVAGAAIGSRGRNHVRPTE